MAGMDVRRLHLLLELSRLGSMREVAETHGLTTSTVSQQIAALAREVGTALVEPDGRRVRLTPAGRRLADHAVHDPGGRRRRPARPGSRTPSRRARCASAGSRPRSGRRCCRSSPPSRQSHPSVRVVISEYEPIEAFALLADDDLDLALTYDYNLAPASPGGDPGHRCRCGRTPWGLGVPGRRWRTTGPVADLAAWARPALDRELAQHRGRGSRADAGVSWPASRRGSATGSTASTSSRT